MTTLVRLAVFAGLLFAGYRGIEEIMARYPLPPGTNPVVPQIIWGLSLLFLVLLVVGVLNALFNRH